MERPAEKSLQIQTDNRTLCPERKTLGSKFTICILRYSPLHFLAINLIN